jgi:hypothetical protein
VHTIGIAGSNRKVVAALRKLTFLDGLQTRFMVTDITITVADGGPSSIYPGIGAGLLSALLHKDTTPAQVVRSSFHGSSVLIYIMQQNILQ